MSAMFKKLLRKLGLLNNAAPEHKCQAGQMRLSQDQMRIFFMELSSSDGSGMVGWLHEPSSDDFSQEDLAKMVQDNSSFRAMGIEPHPVCSVTSSGGKIYYYYKQRLIWLRN